MKAASLCQRNLNGILGRVEAGGKALETWSREFFAQATLSVSDLCDIKIARSSRLENL